MSELIKESIEDKAIFKAIFFAGLPGAGKTSVSKRITDGTVSPKHVNTDIAYEFLAKNSGVSAELAWELYGPKSKAITQISLINYINSMLPMYIDGTGSNPGATIRRAGLLSSVGYDVSLIWVSTNLETVTARMSRRERKVDPNFIQTVYDKHQGMKGQLKGHFGSAFSEVDNNGDNFNAAEAKAYSAANAFFNAPVHNNIGRETIDTLRETGEKYLVPTIYSKEYLTKLASVWYMQ